MPVITAVRFRASKEEIHAFEEVYEGISTRRNILGRLVQDLLQVSVCALATGRA